VETSDKQNGDEGLMDIMNYKLPQITRTIPFTSVVFMGIVLFIIFNAAISVAQVSAGQNIAADSTVEETKQEDEQISKALEDLMISMQMEKFIYQIEDRPDPFMPFISEKVTQPSEADSEDPEKLTGMRQFEPGQLSLVAIMFTESNPMAMVEDSSHRGYIIRRGTKIGKSGIVSDILPNQVIIKQLSYSFSKERKYKTVEMILRKEGEK
jgi:type IV pilus assembly protein PilP